MVKWLNGLRRLPGGSHFRFQISDFRFRAVGEFVEKLLLDAGGVVIVSAALADAKPVEGLAILGCDDKLTPGGFNQAPSVGQLAGKLRTALLQIDGIGAQLLQAVGTRPGAQFIPAEFVGAGNETIQRTQPVAGSFERGVGSGAFLLGGLFSLLAQRQHGL